MNLVEFGQIVRSLRHYNIEKSGNHWTRENLSDFVNLSPHQLGRLERGDCKYLSSQTLQLLAKSFNLTRLEEIEFYSAAVGLTDEASCLTEPKKQLNNLIDIIDCLQVPAYIIDNYADLIAVNSSALKLYQITPDILEYAHKIPLGFNIISCLYSSVLNIKEIIGHSTWREAATLFMMSFRRSTLRFRHTEYFNYIIKLLLKEKQFEIDWHSNFNNKDLVDRKYQFITFNHPHFGPLSYIGTETVINTNKGNLHLLIFNPSDTATFSIFTDTIKKTEQTAICLASWPEKIII